MYNPKTNAAPEVGDIKIVVGNGSRQIDKFMPGVSKDGSAGWETQAVQDKSNLADGIYNLSKAVEAKKNVHPQHFGGSVVHVENNNVYQIGLSDGKSAPSIIKHDRNIFDQALNGKQPEIGQCYDVTYSRGVGTVKGELTQEEGAKLSIKNSRKI
jgi:hypothetical protein